jgi:hypothetical protein
MKQLLFALLLIARALLATDVSVPNMTELLTNTGVPFGNGGQVGCSTNYCVWATTQTGGVYTGHSELAGCGITAGQCAATPVCLTCGNDFAQFGYTTGYGAAATATYVNSTTITVAVGTAGAGYSATHLPTILFSGGAGSCSTITPTVSGGGVATITASGCTAYTSAPTVYIGGGAEKGQPIFDPTNAFLSIGVSNPTYGPNASAGPAAIGNGVDIDNWVCPISVSAGVATLGTCHNNTSIANNYNGILFGRFGGCGPGTVTTCIWMSSRYSNSDSSNSGSLGDYRIRIIPYTTPGGVWTLGTEFTYPSTGGYRICLNTLQTCSTYTGKNYAELDGAYDVVAGAFLLEIAPDTACNTTCSGTGNYFWQNEIVAFAPTGTYGQFDVLVPSGNTAPCGWNEHPNEINGLLYWTTSNFTTLTYNGCATSFGVPPLDKAAVPYYYTLDGAGNVHMAADMEHAFSVTQVNVLGTADRTAVCAARLAQVGAGCSGATVISGGYSAFTTPSLFPLLLKDSNGNASVWTLNPILTLSGRVF